MEASRWWNPRSSFQRIRQWWLRGEICVVTIHNPRMRIEGYFLSNQTDDPPIITFNGIPYACPPVGLLRFQPPQPLPQNSEYQDLEARHKRSFCLQWDRNGKLQGSEDCLYLNIAIPTIPRNNPALLPVMFYIHGGGFVQGGSDLSEPETVVRQNMVFVDLNYRLGIFGFLNMHTENCRGNAGMKDIVMALQWVQKNIVHFGGDPKNVTICGHSAGGSAVNLLMVSPLARGLFHKGIVMAGGIYSPWGYGGHARDIKRLFMGHSETNLTAYALVESMKRDSPIFLLHWILYLQREHSELEPKKIAVFLRPSVECIEEGAFLPQKIEELMLKATPVPTIAGVTEREGYMYFRADLSSNIVELVRTRDEFAEFLKQNFRWSDRSARRLTERVRGMYFRGLRNMQDRDIIQHLSIFISDSYHRRFYDSLRIGNQERPESAPLYVYRFDFFTGIAIRPPEIRIVEGVLQAPIEREAAEHGDDRRFILGQSSIYDAIGDRLPLADRPFARSRALHVMVNMCELWTSFCKTGKPRSQLEEKEWSHHSTQHPRYLHITDTLSMVDGLLFEGRWNLLNEICGMASVDRSLEASPETLRRNVQGTGLMRNARMVFAQMMNSLQF